MKKYLLTVCSKTCENGKIPLKDHTITIIYALAKTAVWHKIIFSDSRDDILQGLLYREIKN